MFDYFPIFTFGDYKLRQIIPSQDSKLFLHYITHPKVAAFIGKDSVPRDIESAYKELSYWGSLYDYRRSFYWAIVNDHDEIIGTAGFNVITQQHLRAELSYDLSYDYWGKGIMTNSLFKILEFALTKLELVRIQATVGQHNINSIKLLERLNFRQEGTLVKYECLQGKFFDFYMYAVTRNV